MFVFFPPTILICSTIFIFFSPNTTKDWFLPISKIEKVAAPSDICWQNSCVCFKFGKFNDPQKSETWKKPLSQAYQLTKSYFLHGKPLMQCNILWPMYIFHKNALLAPDFHDLMICALLSASQLTYFFRQFLFGLKSVNLLGFFYVWAEKHGLFRMFCAFQLDDDI